MCIEVEVVTEKLLQSEEGGRGGEKSRYYSACQMISLAIFSLNNIRKMDVNIICISKGRETSITTIKLTF
jgi:hypothetical protein